MSPEMESALRSLQHAAASATLATRALADATKRLAEAAKNIPRNIPPATPDNDPDVGT